MRDTLIIAGTGPVILVDDNAGDALIARSCYEESALTNPFLTMATGRELLAYLDEVVAGRAPVPALVLLDIAMPEMNGFEVLAAVRGAEAFADVPVVMMLTNSDNPVEIARSTSLGANGFQVKPFALRDYVAFFDSLAPAAATAPPRSTRT
jgi:CheY-like chemotaxis protein